MDLEGYKTHQRRSSILAEDWFLLRLEPRGLPIESITGTEHVAGLREPWLMISPYVLVLFEPPVENGHI